MSITVPAQASSSPISAMSLHRETPIRRFGRRFLRHRMALLSLTFIGVLAVLGIGAPIFAPIHPTETNLANALQPPSAVHWLGTDPVGRDVWSRVVYAIRISLSVGIVSVAIALMITLIFGSLSGFYGGAVDMAIMRFTDIVIAVPGLLLIMIVVSLVGPSIYNVMFALGILGWTGMTRLLRAQILSIRTRDYVIAARALGVSDLRIMFIHILPNALTPVLVAATFSVATAILTEAGLSFLGFGVVPPTPSWGNMLNAARSLSRLQDSPWFWIPPGLMILLTVLAINFIGDGLSDALNPKQHNR